VASRHDDDVPAPKADATDGGRLRGASAVKLHLTLAAGLTICLVAFVIEVGRALGGNSLSWAYVFEWPIFAVFAIYMWWNLLHDPDGRGSGRRVAGGKVDPGDPDQLVNPGLTESTGDTGGSAEPDEPAHAATTTDDQAPTGDVPTSRPVEDPDLAAWQAYLRTMEADEERQAREDGVG
jgi:hypothetical protein